MRLLRSPWAALCFIVALVAGCGGDDDGGLMQPQAITVANFVGSWTAESVTHTNNADATQQFDIVTAGGEVRTTVLDGGRSRTWIEFGTFADEWDAQLTVNGSTVTSTPVEATRPTVTYAFAFVGADRITLTNANGSFDFTLSGAPEVSTTEVTVFVRQ